MFIFLKKSVIIKFSIISLFLILTLVSTKLVLADTNDTDQSILALLTPANEVIIPTTSVFTPPLIPYSSTLAPVISPIPVARSLAPPVSLRPVARPSVTTGGGATPAGGISLPATSCLPPGPPTHGGRDGTPCSVINLTGGVIVGVCQAGSCASVSFTSGLSSFLGNIGIQFAKQAVTGLLGSMFGGGASNYPYSNKFGYSSTTNDYLNFDDSNLGVDVPLDLNSDIIFGNENTTTSLPYNANDNVITPTFPYRPINTDTQNPIYEKQKVNVTVQNTGVAPIPGNNQIEKDIYGVSFNLFNNNDENVITLASLSDGALENRRRQALLNERGGANTGVDITDYRTSSVNSFGENSGTNSLKEKKLSFWQKIINAVKGLFGY